MALRSATSRRRVFIVDDHPLVREWLSGIVARETDLENCGQAGDARTALATAILAKPDLIVVDLSLSKSSGLELIKDLRLQVPAAHILVLSMHIEATFAERAFRAGARGYIVKSESSEHAVEAIRRVLDGQFYASPSLSARLTGRMFGGAAGESASEVLSAREMEAFQLRGNGKSTKEIAEFMKVSVKTVESYEARIKEKLGLQTAGELMREAVRWNDRQAGV